LHLGESSLLVRLIGKANEAVTSRHGRNGICHDFGGLAGRETSLEERNQDVFIDLGAKITNEDRVFWTTIITTTTVSSCFKDAASIKIEEYEPGF